DPSVPQPQWYYVVPYAVELAYEHVSWAGCRLQPVPRTLLRAEPDLDASVPFHLEVGIVEGPLAGDGEGHPPHRAAVPDDPVGVRAIDRGGVVGAVRVVAEALVRRRLEVPQLREQWVGDLPAVQP